MKTTTLTLIIGLILIALAITGCGGGDDEVDPPIEDNPVVFVEDNPVVFVSATPASGDIDENGTITVTFDSTPTGVSVTAGTVTLAGNTATITGPFTPGPLALTINWADGQQTLTYNVKELPPPEGMVRIPAGTFQMGSNFADEDLALPEGGNPDRFRGDEQPVHTVHVDAFYIDTHEVTNTQFKAFVDANPQWQKDQNVFHDGGYLRGWDGNNYPAGKAVHPVVDVSWHAAMAYAQWAGKRLPTEAEWEKAARGGLSGKKYPWGDTITPEDANYGDWPDGNTTPVGNYPPNGYGLYDMTGNVWEWCLDAYEDDFYARSPATNPIAGKWQISWILENFRSIFSNPRVLRGGAYYSPAQDLRVANRFGFTPLVPGSFIGFRCVKDITP